MLIEPAPLALVACAIAAAVLSLVPSLAGARSARAVLALALVVAMGWMVVALAFGPRGSQSTAFALLGIGLLASAVARRWSDPLVRSWVTALALALSWMGGQEFLLAWVRLGGIDLVVASAVTAAAGSVLFVAGHVLGSRTAMTVAALGWVAWLPALALAPGDPGAALLVALVLASLGLLLATLVRPDALIAAAGVAFGALGWVLALGSGRAGWAPGQAPFEAYVVGVLALAVLLVGLLVQAGTIPRWRGWQALATGGIAIGTWSLASLAWLVWPA